MNPSLVGLRATADRVAQEAGAVLRVARKETLRVDSTEQHDIKLELDRRIQEQIRSEIHANYPEDAFLGEEGGEAARPEQREWVVDPIDGTVNLFYGIPHYAVSIACRLNGEALAGAIYDPNRDELFSVHRGGGATCNGVKLQVSKREALDEAILALGFSKGKKTIAKCLQLYQFYGDKVRKIRAMGSAALDLAYVAAGRLDAYIEQGVSIWDIAAGALMVEEAGGKVQKLPSEPAGKIHLVASSGKITLELV